MYLVTTEAIDDGTWCDDPEGFDSEQQAKEYIAKLRDALLPGNCFAIYRCDLVETVLPAPQESGQ